MINENKIRKLKTIFGIISLGIGAFIFILTLIMVVLTPNPNYEKDILLTLITLGFYDIFSMIIYPTGEAIYTFAVGLLQSALLFSAGIVLISKYRFSERKSLVVSAIIYFTFTVTSLLLVFSQIISDNWNNSPLLFLCAIGALIFGGVLLFISKKMPSSPHQQVEK